MERIKNKKIIVTGGTGFIGSHLTKALHDLGANVVVIDIICHEKSYFKEQNLHTKVDLQLIDITNKNKIKKLFKSSQPDYVFHLAAEAIVNDSYHNPYKTFQTNVMGTVSILEAARATEGIKGVIVASSDKAYGKTKKQYTENSPLKGDHPYDVSKSSTDLITQAYYKTYHLPVVITRFGNVYGEGDLHLDRIIPGICEAIIKNSPLLIRSNGKYIRDYLYVKDVVEGYLFLLRNIDTVRGEAFNFSSNDTHSVLELIKQVEKIVKKQITYKILNNAKNEIPYQHLDDKKIKELGWKNAHSLKTALRTILPWYSNILK